MNLNIYLEFKKMHVLKVFQQLYTMYETYINIYMKFHIVEYSLFLYCCK